MMWECMVELMIISHYCNSHIIINTVLLLKVSSALRITKLTITKSTIASWAFFLRSKRKPSPGTRNFMFGATVCCSGTNCGPTVPNQHPWDIQPKQIHDNKESSCLRVVEGLHTCGHIIQLVLVIIDHSPKMISV